MRKLSIVSLLLIASLMLGMLVSAQDAGEFVVPEALRGGEIIVYSPFPDEQIADLARGFTEATGIAVRNIVISTGETFSRLQAESANPQADFWLSVRASILQDAITNEPPLITEYKPATLSQIAEVYQYPDSTFVTGVGMYPLVIFYNTTILEEDGLDIPQTWEDLLDAQYQGKIVMPHPATSGTSYSAVTFFLQWLGEDAGWEYINALAQNVDQFTRSGRAPQNLVAQGEYPIGIGFFDAVYYLASMASRSSASSHRPSSLTRTPPPSSLARPTKRGRSSSSTIC